ncbi:uncharacterized protein LY89DRAFT_149627 [Mollisia scopiformis]|uniref:Uncharacterized protein n=1 Tax=Mollisia scopiformis TaxID=149040 RepID=A0A194X146_MOLSC|nr:uncharacterized protein LY89DRAFT_149627 [Mollisia scopiformis]KUJ13915.1 hypothetical protein LY89DRAFT_149627 [Mollisia scopiformis]
MTASPIQKRTSHPLLPSWETFNQSLLVPSEHWSLSLIIDVQIWITIQSLLSLSDVRTLWLGAVFVVVSTFAQALPRSLPIFNVGLSIR